MTIPADIHNACLMMQPGMTLNTRYLSQKIIDRYLTKALKYSISIEPEQELWVFKQRAKQTTTTPSPLFDFAKQTLYFLWQGALFNENN